MFKLAVILVLGSLRVQSQTLIQGPEGDCGLYAFRPRHVSHFVEGSAVTKVVPQYPPIAEAKGFIGAVRIRIVINKQGVVERTCPVYAQRERKPDRSLIVAAEAAALQWRFK